METVEEKFYKALKKPCLTREEVKELADVWDNVESDYIFQVEYLYDYATRNGQKIFSIGIPTKLSVSLAKKNKDGTIGEKCFDLLYEDEDDRMNSLRSLITEVQARKGVDCKEEEDHDDSWDDRWVAYLSKIFSLNGDMEEKANEAVDHPEHYQLGSGEHEPIDVIKDWGLNFNLGNAVKYISRAGHKNDIIQDLKKARFYLNYEIERLEKEDK